jgi:hypothetical protein
MGTQSFFLLFPASDERGCLPPSAGIDMSPRPCDVDPDRSEGFEFFATQDFWSAMREEEDIHIQYYAVPVPLEQPVSWGQECG